MELLGRDVFRAADRLDHRLAVERVKLIESDNGERHPVSAHVREAVPVRTPISTSRSAGHGSDRRALTKGRPNQRVARDDDERLLVGDCEYPTKLARGTGGSVPKDAGALAVGQPRRQALAWPACASSQPRSSETAARRGQLRRRSGTEQYSGRTMDRGPPRHLRRPRIHRTSMVRMEFPCPGTRRSSLPLRLVRVTPVLRGKEEKDARTVIAGRHCNRQTSTSISVSVPTTVLPVVEALIRAVATIRGEAMPG